MSIDVECPACRRHAKAVAVAEVAPPDVPLDFGRSDRVSLANIID